jgi:hypothetical protein
MENEMVPRQLRLRKDLWDLVDADAERCKRSANRHIEALLEAYFQATDINVNMKALAIAGELMPNSKTEVKVGA